MAFSACVWTARSQLPVSPEAEDLQSLALGFTPGLLYGDPQSLGMFRLR